MESPSTIARAFEQLADRFDEVANRAKAPQHLVRNISDHKVQAGRLLMQALDADLFPKGRQKQNRGWWNREIGRIPGDVRTLYGEIPQWAITSCELKLSSATVQCMNDAEPDAEQRILTDAARPFEPDQFKRCWLFALTLWLAAEFRERFRHNAAAFDWWQAKTDKDGRYLDKNGEPLVGQWYLNGEPLPPDFEFPTRRVHESMTAAEREEFLSTLTEEDWRKEGIYEWRLGEVAATTDSFDKDDWLDHQQSRAHVQADACRLLAELIEPSVDAAPPTETDVADDHPPEVNDDTVIVDEGAQTVTIGQRVCRFTATKDFEAMVRMAKRPGLATAATSQEVWRLRQRLDKSSMEDVARAIESAGQGRYSLTMAADLFPRPTPDEDGSD